MESNDRSPVQLKSSYPFYAHCRTFSSNKIYPLPLDMWRHKPLDSFDHIKYNEVRGLRDEI